MEGSCVAQLAERSLLIPENLGSNPDIGNFYLTFIYCLRFVEKMKNKEKEGENGPFFKKT